MPRPASSPQDATAIAILAGFAAGGLLILIAELFRAFLEL